MANRSGANLTFDVQLAMTRQVVSYILGALAFGLIALGLFWNSLFPPASYWSPQQARQYQDAFYAAHAAQDAVDHGKLVHDGAELQAARERYELIQAELNEARLARGRSGKLLVVGGLILLLATVVLRHFWAAPSEEIDR
jgi:hypothetical protein